MCGPDIVALMDGLTPLADRTLLEAVVRGGPDLERIAPWWIRHVLDKTRPNPDLSIANAAL